MLHHGTEMLSEKLSGHHLKAFCRFFSAACLALLRHHGCRVCAELFAGAYLASRHLGRRDRQNYFPKIIMSHCAASAALSWRQRAGAGLSVPVLHHGSYP
jgi:hypothetical protein